jgi:hypothetical protein
VLSVGSANAIKLEVRRIGYRPASIEIAAGNDTTISVTMYAVPQRLAAVKVMAEQLRKLEMAGFYERLANREKWGGSGQFLTPEDIELRKPHRVTQLLEGLNGVSTRRSDECATALVRCWVAVGHDNCVMAVYLDGHRLEPERLDPTVPKNRHPVYIDELAHVADISALEVYSRPTQAPPQYQSDVGRCGIVLIWTK